MAANSKKYMRTYMREYYKTKPEKRQNQREYQKKQYVLPAFRAKKLWTGAKTRARNFKLNFDLTVDWVEERMTSCEITGAKFDLSLVKERCNPYAPSIERVNNKKGYTKDNCKVVLWALNNAKAEMNMRQFKKIIKLIWEGINR